VQASLNERTGIDGKPYAIGMELRLPKNWNGRFLFQGGGGTDGRLMPALGAQNVGASPNALTQGFAVASTDAGHRDEPGPTGGFLFGADPQARIDYGYNHLPVVRNASLAMIDAFYHAKPKYSYFSGCSNGGRQGMMASQRFPDFFDGIVVGAPANRVTDASLDAMSHTQILASIAPKGSDGRPVLGAALSPADLKTLADGILKSCDALDGATDGIVSHPAACKFDPASVQCASGATENCLPGNKVDAIRKIFAGAKDSTGKSMYISWPYDPGINSPMWTMWKMGPPTASPPQAANTTLVAGALSHVFSTPPVMTTDLYGFMLNTKVETLSANFDRIQAPFTESGAHVVNAVSDDVSAFTKHGGKLLFFHGMADGIFSPNDSISYLDKLHRKYSDKTDSFARLFLVPGMAHCGGGPATDQFDALGAVVQWVEKGSAPSQLLAKGSPRSAFPGRTRPLCAFPKEATYNGSGNIEDAASFSCR
jgi:feruloyl esterase